MSDDEIICHNCGNTLDMKSNVCPYCGWDLGNIIY